MSLSKYNQKRDFKKTAEPEGIKKHSKGALRFVVQKHAASHLHYDFRLEIDGVLVSWAVPKGPSANPADKRLAMHVEDHPMDYIDFEGTIPQGEYGGGTVMVWDIGTYHAEGNDDASKDNALMKKQHAAGSIKIVIEGEKLKGSWALVEMHGRGENQWLLIKHNDEFAGKEIVYDPNSILTNRDFDEIAKGNDVWESNRNKTSGKKPDELNDEDSDEEEDTPSDKKTYKKEDAAFSADDLANAKKVSSFPDNWRPQLATLADAPFNNDEWLFETKYDGYRSTAEINTGKCMLISRNGLSFNKRYPELAKELSHIKLDLILDGEIVMEDTKGKSHFQWLQNREDNPNRGKLKFYVFDILYFSGFDLRGLNVLQRKKILKAVLPKSEALIYSDHTIRDGEKAFKKAQKDNGEGIIAKRISSVYHTDKRSKDWLKIKTEKLQEMVIGGYTEPSGGRVGIGALLCGYYQDGKLMYSGKVGSGYTEEILRDLKSKLEKIERQSSPFENTPKEKNVHWVTPKLVANIKFFEFTETNSMRHPVYQGLRPDKAAKDVKLELPEVSTSEKRATKLSVKKSEPKKASPEMTHDSKSPTVSELKKMSKKVEFSNPDKIFWPNEKITKGDVIVYYNAISNYILPYLKDRPQSMRRTPDGIKSQGFFQKNVAGIVPDWTKTTVIQSDSKSEPIEWLICNDKDTLLYMVNMGCIEINPWSSRVKTLDNPDYIIFDLDPKGAPIGNIVETAHVLKALLDQLKVPAYIKTSGGNGLHVFIPVKPKYSYDQTREFSHIISQMVHKQLPDTTSLERMPDKRKGKVYLDFLQNGRGKTMASIYSLRPREGAGVSTPLEWDEVANDLVLSDYNLFTIPARLKEKGDLWKGFFDDAIDLKSVLKSL